jgi:hypothetical protein
VHDDILAKYPAARLKVLAVWFDMLPGDSRQLLDTRVLADPRVTYYWDSGKLTGQWFTDHVTHRKGITWDAYFLYGPNARWDRLPDPLVVASSRGPVIGSTDALTAAIRPYLR